VADLGQFDIAGGAATWANDWLEVTTPEAQWAYAALIPLRTGSAWRGRRLVLEFACEWLAGTCEVGILNSEGSAFVTTASISADSGPGFALSAPQPERCSSIVIRNASPHGPSACRLRLISAALAAQYAERRIPVQY
jgi:hypothetical protein